MLTINAKKLLVEFHSAEMDVDELKKLIKDFILETHPGDEIKSFDINREGFVDVVLESGKEIEIEVDWNELVLK